MKKIILGAIVAAYLVAAVPVSAQSEVNSSQSASAFLVELSWGNVRAQYGKVWSKLHPRYQRVTTRAFWEACQRKKDKAAAGIDVHAIRAIDEYPDTVTLPVLGSVKVRAVTLEMRYSHPLLGINKKMVDTVYALKWGSTWKGLWEPETYTAYAKWRCPA